jgi:hypothetical protein
MAEQNRGRQESEETRGMPEDDNDPTWTFEHDDANPDNAAVTNRDQNESDRRSNREDAHRGSTRAREWNRSSR